MLLLYFILWMILFGSFTVESVLFGIGISFVIFAFTCAFMGYSMQTELNLYSRIPEIIHFLTDLVKDVIKANFTIVRMLFVYREEIEPVIVHFHSDLKTSVAKAVFADSITLTPGTITVFLRDDEFVVHCLDESIAPGIDRSECKQDLSDIEKE